MDSISEKGKISLFTAILMNINIMVGAGIFIAPSIMAQKASFASFLGWPLVGILFFPVVWSIAQITKYFPGQSSFYNYSKNGINKTAGFITGWLYFLGYTSITSTLIIAMQDTISEQFKLQIILENKILFYLIIVLFFCFLNLLSVSIISKIQNFVTIYKLLPIVFVILIFIFYWNPNFSINIANIPKLKYALPFALFGFWGFESSCNISHLIKGDKKNAFLSIIIGFFIAVGTYTIFNFGILHIMNAENLAKYDVAGFANFLHIKSIIMLNLFNAIVCATVIIAYFSSAFGIFFSNSSNLHSMAKDNLFPFSNFVKKTNKNQRPSNCIWLMGIITLSFIYIIRSKEILTPICNLGTLFSFLLTLISLFLIQLKREPRRSKLIITILSFVSCYLLIHYSWITIAPNISTRLLYALPLIILVLFGFLIFKIKEKNNER